MAKSYVGASRRVVAPPITNSGPATGQRRANPPLGPIKKKLCSFREKITKIIGAVNPVWETLDPPLHFAKNLNKIENTKMNQVYSLLFFLDLKTSFLFCSEIK